ncbi:hypothetical protein [Virgibacillus senegalensis]|uniref:hypothetical protein n=1 Tax=Virgibacillus senegalensis TaxID=1499679 RepID=UPI000AE88E10|nr:hypothetical protein [Virgibacillus senegalensis]
MFKVTGLAKGGIRIEFYQDNEQLVFESYEEATAFIEKAKKENTLPDNYQLIIEEVAK